jgi:Fe-S cluster assembly protein SufD
MTTSVLNEKNHYLSQFEELERELGDRDPPWLRRLRKTAIARFAELGFPTARNEDWKFTNVGALVKVPFRLAEPARHDLYGEDSPRRDARPGEYRLVFENGTHWPAQSPRLALPSGTLIGGLAEAIKKHSEHVEPYLGRHVRHEEHAFTALNTAFIRDGAFIFIPEGKVIGEPLHLVFMTVNEEPTLSHPRNLIVAGRNSHVTIVEHHFGRGSYCTNAVTEIVVGDGAVIDHYKQQDEDREAFHIATTAVHQARGSNFRTHYFGLGGKLVRNEVHVRFDGEGCEATVNGLYLASGTQHMDNFTVIDHAKPHCASHELYKGILDGKAHGVFNGKIFVRPDAQKTDAKQTNQTLLLSEDAIINTKPQLEIFADDVKCTHGATVGQLDPNQLFYLRARGLGEAEARNLLTFAFANDVIGRIKVESLRRQLEEMLMSRQHLRKD